MSTKPPSAIADDTSKLLVEPAESTHPPMGIAPDDAHAHRHWGRLVLLAFLVLIATYVVYSVRNTREALSEGLIQANGRIEGDTISVGSKFAGRIEKVFVREGDRVEQGQILARLEDNQVRARVAHFQQAVAAAESQLAAARIALETARKEVPLSIEAAKASVARAEAGQSKAEAADQQAARDAQRFQRLAEKGSVGKQRAEQAQLAATTARSDLESAGTALSETKQQLRLAELGWDRIRSKEGEIDALEAQAKQARAALQEVESVQTDLTIHSPINGIVTSKIRNIGEIVSVGAPLYEVVDLDKLYLKVYVPENQIGKLRLSLPAQVFTDAYPDQPFEATVRYVSSRAEFTPKEVQTADERVKLVFVLKLYLGANPEHRLMPGMPADAIIRWNESASWAKPLR